MSQQNGGGSSVSFKITNPTGSTSSRPQASTSSGTQHRNSHRHHHSHQRYASDSESDDDEFGNVGRRKAKDESISAIDSKGIRCVRYQCVIMTQQLKYTSHRWCSSSSAAKKDKPLVIPTAPNKDFRRAALELRAQKEGRQRFIPGQVSSMQGGDVKERVLTEAERQFLESDSNVQRIGDKAAVGGIKQRTMALTNRSTSNDVDMSRDHTPVPGTNGFSKMVEEEESGMAVDADALALRELLKEHDEDEDHQTKVHIIPQAPAVTEEEAYALDVAQRPDTPDLEAYQRVPIEDFGAALLRGMGGGNKKPRPKVEAYVPKQRTALLGIGAKSREETFGKDWVAQQDGVKKGSNKREQMKFMPLQRVERASSSGTASPAPLPLESGRSAEGSSSRRRRNDDYSNSESREKRRRKSRRSYDDQDDSEEDARRRERRRNRSRSPRDSDKDRRDNDRSRRDDREHESKRSRDDRDRDGGSSRRERERDADRDDRKESRRDRRDDDGDRHKERKSDYRDRDRKYRDDDRDRRRH